MQERIKEIIILILVAVVVFFATRYYRDELILQQSNIIAQQSQTIRQTETLLNQVAWQSPQAVDAWRSLGYKMNPTFNTKSAETPQAKDNQK